MMDIQKNSYKQIFPMGILKKVEEPNVSLQKVKNIQSQSYSQRKPYMEIE
jgi:hypothetical protein